MQGLAGLGELFDTLVVFEGSTTVRVLRCGHFKSSSDLERSSKQSLQAIAVNDPRLPPVGIRGSLMLCDKA